MKICPNCHKEYESGKFCLECGTALTEKQDAGNICPECGTQNASDAKFCEECGHRLGESASTIVEGKNSFDVVLKTAGTAKLSVLKIVMDSCGLGLREAKNLVDNTPSTIIKGVPKNKAESLKIAIKEVGAEVELK